MHFIVRFVSMFSLCLVIVNWISFPICFITRIKPAAFDLFLGGCIAAYLAIVYYAIEVGRHSQFTLVYIDCPFDNKPCHWIQKSAFSQRGY